jgi:hypothetical protein
MECEHNHGNPYVVTSPSLKLVPITLTICLVYVIDVIERIEWETFHFDIFLELLQHLLSWHKELMGTAKVYKPL